MKKPEQYTFFSHGKLLISGEYFVLIGAKAFAVPLIKGQTMQVNCYESNQYNLHWETTEMGKPWFNANFNSINLQIRNSSDTQKASSLQRILKEIIKLKPGLLNDNKSYHFNCNIQFNTKWGWGSSSTLISNLANWAGIDPFDLNKRISTGSGYDIATSCSQSPIFYQINKNIREIIPVPFNPVFKKSIYFIYSGNKQDTSKSIEAHLQSVIKNKKWIPVISALSEKIAGEENLREFMKHIAEHEKIISDTLAMPVIKEKYFNDFEGEVKSLGAWNGDFVMVISELDENRIWKYFNDKGWNTIFRFEEIVKN